MTAMRTFQTLMFSHVADAAFVCSCGGILLAAQRISPNQPFRSSRLEIPNYPFAAHGFNNRVADKADLCSCGFR